MKLNAKSDFLILIFFSSIRKHEDCSESFVFIQNDLLSLISHFTVLCDLSLQFPSYVKFKFIKVVTSFDVVVDSLPHQIGSIASNFSYNQLFYSVFLSTFFRKCFVRSHAVSMNSLHNSVRCAFHVDVNEMS